MSKKRNRHHRNRRGGGRYTAPLPPAGSIVIHEGVTLDGDALAFLFDGDGCPECERLRGDR